jgi:hypothetical protein
VLAQGGRDAEVRPWVTALQAHARLHGDVRAESRIANVRDDLDSMRRLAEEALPLARRADSPRLEAVVLANLADAHARQKRPAEALQAAERALPVVRRHNDRRAELALTNMPG